MASDAPLRLTLVYSPAPRQIEQIALNLNAPCTVWQALEQSGLLQRHPELTQTDAVFGIWGRKVGPDQLLRDLDRVEAYRALRVDPKVARRERFAKQGTRAAGLFVKRRAPAQAST